jgi:hypothetical protein
MCAHNFLSFTAHLEGYFGARSVPDHGEHHLGSNPLFKRRGYEACL